MPRVSRVALMPLIRHLCGSDTALPMETADMPKAAVCLLIEAPLAEVFPVGPSKTANDDAADAQVLPSSAADMAMGPQSGDADANAAGVVKTMMVGVKRSRAIDLVDCESTLQCRDGKDFKRVLSVATAFFAREKKANERKRVEQRHAEEKKRRKKKEEEKARLEKAARMKARDGREKKEREMSSQKDLQQQQLEYDRNRKEQMTRGGGRNRFDDVDEEVYYKNAIGSAALQVDMKGRFGETGADGAAGADEPVPMPSQNPTAVDERQRRRQSEPKDKRQEANLRKERAKVPIIIVPASYSAMVCGKNARQFLQDGRYVPVRDCVAPSTNSSTHTQEIERRIGRDSPVPYQIRDTAPPRKSSDWERVVAVFVAGPKWQFKDWPFKGCDEGDMVHAFQRIRAFHAHFMSDSVKADVKNWNVKMISLDRNNRHTDVLKAQEFWRELDVFLGTKRTKLRY